MPRLNVLRNLALAALICGGAAASDRAEAVEFAVTGDLFFIEAFNNDALQSGVDTAIRTRLANGAAFSGTFTAETGAVDTNPDPNLGDYRDFITNGAMSAGGFGAVSGAPNCVSADLDCRLEVANDTIFSPGGDPFDRAALSTGFFEFQALTDAVIADSGADSGVPFFDLNDTPFIGSVFLSAGFAIGLVDSDAAVDPSNFQFDTGSFSLFIPGGFQENGSELARYNFELRNLAVGAPASVPLPAVAPIFGLTLIAVGAAAYRRRQA